MFLLINLRGIVGLRHQLAELIEAAQQAMRR